MACTLTAVPYPSTEAVLANLVRTPGFEYGVGSWTVDPGTGGAATGQRLGPFADYVHPVPPSRRGGYFYRQSWSVGTSAPNGGPYVLEAGAATAAAVHSFSMWARSSRAQQLGLVITWRNSGGGVISTATSAGVQVAASTWTRLTFTPPAAPAGAVDFVMQVRPVPGVGAVAWQAGDVLDVDGALAEVSPAPSEWFDGDTPSTPGVRYSWTGAVGASFSWRTTRTPAATAQQVTVERARYDAQRESAAVLHDVVGRADPLVTLGPLRTRRGRLEVWCADEATAHAVTALYGLGRVVMLRDPDHPYLEMYHVATSAATEPAQERTAPWRWTVSVQFAETYGTASAW